MKLSPTQKKIIAAMQENDQANIVHCFRSKPDYVFITHAMDDGFIAKSTFEVLKRDGLIEKCNPQVSINSANYCLTELGKTTPINQ